MKNFLLVIIFFSSFLFVDSIIVDLKKTPNKVEEMRFVYISYLEYLNNFKGNSKTVNKTIIDKMIDNISYNGFNAIILQVSPFSDAIYKSEIFPYSYTLTGVEGKNPGLDYLEYFIKKAHSKNILLHAWINPYRISSKNDLNMLSQDNPAIKFLETENIGLSNKGIYYDPTSELVKTLIEKQVLELIKNYDIDGIHFDDYFYVDYEIDKEEYQKYILNNEEISLDNFRLMHTNDLIKRIGTLIKKFDENIVFSISPDGNINNNYNYHYADIKTWINNGYVDILMPQLYYGFNNQYLPFEKAFNNWDQLIKESTYEIKLVPVLAFYKLGNVDEGAGIGKNEWMDDDVITKQIKFLKDKSNYNGYGLFRYDFMFNNAIDNEVTKKAIFNIRKLCK